MLGSFSKDPSRTRSTTSAATSPRTSATRSSRTSASAPSAPSGSTTTSRAWAGAPSRTASTATSVTTRFYFNGYLNLGLRVDRWHIAGPLFKAHFAEAERERLAKRGRDKLGKKEKEELAAAVSRRLRKQIVPTMKVVDLSWNLDAGVVRFWSQSPRLCETLGEIFEATFGVDLVPESPFTAADRLGLAEAHARAISLLSPSVFAAVA